MVCSNSATIEACRATRFNFAFSMFEARAMADFMRSGSVQGAARASALWSLSKEERF